MPKNKRVNFTEIKCPVRYRIFNGVVQISINKTLLNIAKNENKSYEPDEVLLFEAFIDKGKSIANNIFNVRNGNNVTKVLTNNINKSTTKKKAVWGLGSGSYKRQKMSFDTVKPDRWSEEAFVQYYDTVHTKKYGIRSIEVADKSKAIGHRSPKARIKTLIARFNSFGLGKADVKKYIDWAFDNKSGKFVIGLGFLCSDTCIQEWMVKGKKNDEKKSKVKIY